MTRTAQDLPEEIRPWCRDYRGRDYSFDEFLKLTESFHGYAAPGVLIGARMVDIAMRRMPSGTLFDAVCESSKCLPDAVQLLTPCTWGNGWLRVVPMGRYALTLFDKRTGGGIRVFLNPAQLDACSEIRYWFFGIKPKRKDTTDFLLQEIREAQDRLYCVQTVCVKPELLSKKPSAHRAICPDCGEAYPVGHGRICRGCRLETSYIVKEENR